MPTYSAGGRVSPVAALVESFGNAFADTHNKRIQQQLAMRHAQDSAIAETLVKSAADNVELWDNPVFRKAADSVLGKDNAAATAEAQIAHANSPLGLIIKALGEGAIAAPVSAGADGPGTGPSVPFNELNPHDRTAVAQARLGQMTPAEAGLGFNAGVGNLVRDTQLQQMRDPTTGLMPGDQAKLDLQKQKLALTQENTDKTAKQKQIDVERRNLEFRNKVYSGVTEMRQTPVGERMVKRYTDPNTGQTYISPIGSLKQAPAPEGLSGQMRDINSGIALSHQLIQTAREKPAEVRNLFAPFVGKTLADVEKNVGALTDTQRLFLNKLLRLRNARVAAQGGKQLTQTELNVYNEVLPSDLNTTARMMGVALEDTQDGLIMQNAINENAATRNRQTSPKTNLFSKEQRAIYKRYRAAALHSARHAAQIPLGPGEKLYTGNVRDLIQLPNTSSVASPAATSGADPEAQAVDAAFLQ